jgi:rare lipoprotein A
MHDLRRTIASSLLAALGLLALAATPATAQSTDASGGMSPTAPAQVVPVATGGPLLPAPVDLGGRIGAVMGMQVAFSGSLPGAAGREIAVQRQDRRGWKTVATTTAQADGSFSAAWTVDRVGSIATRAILSGPGAVQAASVQTPLVPITGYRAAKATYFGPGLFGRRTACGQRLTRSLRGIAHRSLRCGSVVELVYEGRVLRAPVVDRGPFTRGIRYDLTQATARDLGFTATDTIGAAQVQDAPRPQASR